MQRFRHALSLVMQRSNLSLCDTAPEVVVWAYCMLDRLGKKVARPSDIRHVHRRRLALALVKARSSARGIFAMRTASVT